MANYWPESIYTQTYRLLRELWEPAYKSRLSDPKSNLRQLRENNPAAYQAAFRSFWENKRDIRQRRKLKADREALRQAERDAAWPKTSVSFIPMPGTEEHVRQWLIEKGLIPREARL